MDEIKERLVLVETKIDELASDIKEIKGELKHLNKHYNEEISILSEQVGELEKEAVKFNFSIKILCWLGGIITSVSVALLIETIRRAILGV